jgi:curli biogenesis system outer membrane secretion channel CsgG
MIKLFAMIASISLITLVGNAEAAKKRVAVLDFEDTAIAEQNSQNPDNPFAIIAALRGQQQQQAPERKIGKNVAGQLVNELAKDGTFMVLERSQIQKIFDEQNISKSGAIDQSSAAKLGKLLGVSAIVTGSVNEFTVQSHKRGVLGIGVKVNTAKVGLNARIIDANTGEIIATAEGKGEEESSNAQVGSFYGSSESGSENSLLGIATKKALNEVIAQLKTSENKLKEIAVTGAIAYSDTAKNSTIADIGRTAGISTGAPLYVSRVVKEIKNSSGAVIKVITDNVAEIKVKEVDEQTCTCECVSGDCKAIAEGMRVSTIK